MWKSTISSVLKFGSCIVLFYGCASMGPSDEERVGRTLGTWKAGFEEGDLEKIMETYSNNYEGQRGGGKEEVRKFMAGLIDEGSLEAVRVDYSEAKTTIDENTAIVSPIILRGDFGGREEIRLERIFQREEGNVWRFVGSEFLED